MNRSTLKIAEKLQVPAGAVQLQTYQLYFRPQKDKIKTYDAVRRNDRVVISLSVRDDGSLKTQFRRCWQTEFGWKESKPYKLNIQLYPTAGIISLDVAELEKYKDNFVDQTRARSFFKTIKNTNPHVFR